MSNASKTHKVYTDWSILVYISSLWSVKIFLSYTNADLKICQYICLHMKIICQRFPIKTPSVFSDVHVRYARSLITNI